MMSNQKVIFVGGCFWGLQDLICNQFGVVFMWVGYSGGNIFNVIYCNYGMYVEVVEIIFDFMVIDYCILLEFFFQIYDLIIKDW